MFLIEVIFSFFITVGFAVLFNVKGRLIIYSGLGGAISWCFYLLLKEKGYSYPICYFVATLITVLYCEITSEKIKTTVLDLLVASLIPMAPGGGVYYTMFYLLNNQYNQAILKGAETVIIAGAMALGVVIGTSFSRIFHYFNGKNV